MRAFVHESLPGRVVFGPGVVDQVGAELARLANVAPGTPENGASGAMFRRVGVVASGSARAGGERIAATLGPRFAGFVGEVRQHVPEDLAARAVAAARDLDLDAVVTVGGGSAIGLGKVVAVETEVPLVAVPTTYSGSEMTPIYGVTGSRKRTVRDLRALPKVVLYDPELTVGLPRRVTASSGFNALAHSIESFYAPGRSPVVALGAEQATRTLVGALVALADYPTDLAARSDALYGAYLAGAAVAVAGTALQHKLSHVLGGSFGLDHADVHAVLLPHVTDFNAAFLPPHANSGGALYDLADKVGAPRSLAAIGMPPDGLASAAAQAVAAVGDSNPRPVDEAALRQLLTAAYEGRRPGSLFDPSGPRDGRHGSKSGDDGEA